MLYVSLYINSNNLILHQMQQFLTSALLNNFIIETVDPLADLEL